MTTNPLILFIYVFLLTSYITAAPESGISIPMDPGFIHNNLVLNKIPIDLELNIPDFVQATYELTGLHTQTPISFDFSKIYITESRCAACLINKYQSTEVNIRLMNKVAALCNQDLSLCKYSEQIGVKGYELDINFGVIGSLDTQVAVVLVNSFSGNIKEIMIPSNKNTDHLQSFKAADSLLGYEDHVGVIGMGRKGIDSAFGSSFQSRLRKKFEMKSQFFELYVDTISPWLILGRYTDSEGKYFNLSNKSYINFKREFLDFEMIHDTNYLIEFGSIAIQSTSNTKQGDDNKSNTQTSIQILEGKQTKFKLNVNTKFMYLVDKIYYSISNKLCTMLENDKSIDTLAIQNTFCQNVRYNSVGQSYNEFDLKLEVVKKINSSYKLIFNKK